MQSHNVEEKPKKQTTARIKSYTKYSGMVYQIFGMLAITVFAGLKVDAYFGNEDKLITAGATMFVLVTFLYKIAKNTNN